MRVLAAMSGGVDSAVAAARAVDAGHDVTGVHFALSANPAAERDGARGCCTLSDARDARRAADAIGIPFYVWDLATRFSAEVVEDFLAEYAAGRTPNPCLRCNERIKFAAVLDRALALGFDAVCTGHYARMTTAADGRAELRRAADLAKDQSYVLAVTPAERLPRLVLPLAELTKAQVREQAGDRGLQVANKPDSHDICFIPDGDTAGWLQERLGDQPGEIRDAITGDQLGTHAGAYRFTIGQRRGLALDRPSVDGAARYVVAVDPTSRVVSVGPPAMLSVSTIMAGPITWVDLPWRGQRGGLFAQIRAHGEPVPATAEVVTAGTAVEQELIVHLAEPLRAVAPGQTVVLYEGDLVLASATVSRALPPPRLADRA
jgi:tRNA-specific 2-thiouridylase